MADTLWKFQQLRFLYNYTYTRYLSGNGEHNLLATRVSLYIITAVQTYQSEIRSFAKFQIPHGTLTTWNVFTWSSKNGDENDVLVSVRAWVYRFTGDENETEGLKFTALYSFYIDGKFILYVEFENDTINKWITFPIFTAGQWSGRETGRWSISKQSPLMFVLDSLGVNCNGCARRCLLELNTPPLINKAQLPLMSNRKHRNFYAPFPHLSLLNFLIPHISM